MIEFNFILNFLDLVFLQGDLLGLRGEGPLGSADPGDIFQIRQNTERLAYIIREIARFWKNQVLADELDTLRQRIRHGVPEKYLDLVKIKNVGRVRAKILYKYNFHDRVDLKKATLEKLAAIDKIGMTIAKSIKLQIEKVG